MTEDWKWLFIGSLFMAAVFAYFRPTLEKANTPFDHLKNIGLTYFHSLCWATISLYCLIHYANYTSLYWLANKLIIGGMALYFLFIGLFIFHRFSRQRKKR